MLQQTWIGAKNLEKYGNMLGALSGKEKNLVLVRAMNRTGDGAKTQVIRALAKQTGLKQKVIRTAIGKPKRASFSDFDYVMRTKGGKIALKHFGAREVRGGVVAKPFGKRTKFENHFITSGKPGRRFSMMKFKGHVHAADNATRKWGRPFEAFVKSDVSIPEQMVEGETAKAFTQAAEQVLPRRIEHELQRILL